MEANKSKIFRMGWQTGEPEGLMFQSEFSLLENALLLGKGSIFLFYSGLQLIGGGSTTYLKVICFTQSPAI